MSLYEDKSDDVLRDGGFEKLKEDGMMRKFDFVIVDSIYRCGKTVSNARDLLQMVFYPAGIGFAVLEDGFCSIGKSDGEMDEYFINAIRLACLKPFADKRRNDWNNGIFTVHDEKYGYHLSDDRKSFSVDEEAAPIIREIFELADSGKRMTEITDYLNEQGYESYGSHLKRVAKKSKPQISTVWTVGAVKTILHTASYKGKGTRNLDGVTYEYDIPAIVTAELYDGVQEKLAANGEGTCAQSLPDSDFLLALSNGHNHNVHDSNAADKKRNSRNTRKHDAERGCNLAHLVNHRLHGLDSRRA